MTILAMHLQCSKPHTDNKSTALPTCIQFIEATINSTLHIIDLYGSRFTIKEATK